MLARLLGFSAIAIMLTGCASTSLKDVGGTPSPVLSDGDNHFYKAIAGSNTTEIQTSQLALTQSANQQVKDFAQHMITDHTTAQTELSTLAAQKGVGLPTMLDDKHQAIVDMLKDKSGPDFDKAYVDAQIAAHKETITADQNEADNGTDPDTKAIANHLLVTLKMHLDMAQKLQQSAM